MLSVYVHAELLYHSQHTKMRPLDAYAVGSLLLATLRLIAPDDIRTVTQSLGRIMHEHEHDAHNMHFLQLRVCNIHFDPDPEGVALCLHLHDTPVWESACTSFPGVS